MTDIFLRCKLAYAHTRALACFIEKFEKKGETVFIRQVDFIWRHSSTSLTIASTHQRPITLLAGNRATTLYARVATGPASDQSWTHRDAAPMHRNAVPTLSQHCLNAAPTRRNAATMRCNATSTRCSNASPPRVTTRCIHALGPRL